MCISIIPDISQLHFIIKKEKIYDDELWSAQKHLLKAIFQINYFLDTGVERIRTGKDGELTISLASKFQQLLISSSFMSLTLASGCVSEYLHDHRL